MIGKEDGNIPLLACVNEKGSVREIDDTKLVIDLYGKVIAERAYEQLSNLSVIIIPDEIILTHKETRDTELELSLGINNGILW
jgi:malate/lactate dehydrogenase